jgi:hypothetical protein
VTASQAQGDKVRTKLRTSDQTEFLESAKNPDRSVVFQRKVIGKLAPPPVVHDYRSATLGSLHHSFCLAPVAVGAAIRQKHIDGCLIVSVTTLNEGEG